MQRLFQIFILIGFLPGLSACSVIDDTLLTEEVREFSRGVVALSAIITQEFSLAEEVNTLGFMDNLQFQLELGGNPDTNLKPLFSASDIAARQSLLAALNGYAETLVAVASGKPLSSEYSKLVGTTENLKQLTSGHFNLAHSLSILDSDQLVNDVSVIDRLIILPERDRRLLPIIEKGGSALSKMAILLYFDIGAVSDQSSKCSYTYPKNELDADLSSLRLCKGGLRSIVNSAISFDTNVWKDKLAYLKTQDQKTSRDRRIAIERLVSIQKLGQRLDQLLSETQTSLIAMVNAHDALEKTLKDAEKSSGLPVAATSKSILFVERLRGLTGAAASIESALSTLSVTNSAAQNLQPSFNTQTDTGVNDDKEL